MLARAASSATRVAQVVPGARAMSGLCFEVRYNEIIPSFVCTKPLALPSSGIIFAKGKLSNHGHPACRKFAVERDPA